ncbi:uncharacterized protein LOC117638985 [Thrips palmi]|uniref:Uncharacterized protein LOC117638985 n=1 Tax=Thrips palmi TaxID=161013 RepID=A0A6P8XTA6_THRPL|nr:uncharacterized protein LOC117638985 [Thrips palmi]
MPDTTYIKAGCGHMLIRHGSSLTATMEPARPYFFVLAVMAIIIAAAGDDQQTAQKLQAESQKIAEGATKQLLAAFAKLRSDYDATEAAELKAASAAVKAALSAGSAKLAKMRVPQRAALQAFARSMGKESSELTGKYTSLINLYIKDKAAAKKENSIPAIRKLRQGKQAALKKWEEDLVALFSDMRSALRAAYKNVASSADVQKSVDVSVVKLVDALIDYQHGVLSLTTATLFAEVQSFAAQADTALLHLANHAYA